MKTLISAIAILLATAAPSYAGSESGDWATCKKDLTGAGYCEGTMRGFRNGPDGNDRADFYFNGRGSAQFSAFLNGSYYACWFPKDQQASMFASVAGRDNGFFLVSFDAAGTCTDAYRYSGSDFGSSY
jgi:hypothetical protein